MPTHGLSPSVRIGSALAFFLVLAGCTQSGQFDPTEALSSDIFDTKKKIQGDRQPLFPNGVPGAESGVPPELIKGYQAPPEQAAANGDAAAAGASTANPKSKQAAEEAAVPPKPKPKPKHKVARAPAAQPQASVPNQPPAQSSGQSIWPDPPRTTAAPQTAQSGQSVWPSPQPSQPAPTNWPAPPSGAPQQSGQSSQSIWPNPPPPGTYSH